VGDEANLFLIPLYVQHDVKVVEMRTIEGILDSLKLTSEFSYQVITVKGLFYYRMPHSYCWTARLAVASRARVLPDIHNAHPASSRLKRWRPS